MDSCGVCGGAGSSCGGSGSSGSKSFPVGAVIGIIVLACALIGAGVWLYMRRQNLAMKNDIDELLKQVRRKAFQRAMRAPQECSAPQLLLRRVSSLIV